MEQLNLFHKAGGSQKERIFQKAKASLHAALFFVGPHELLVGEDRSFQNVRADDPARLAQGFLLDLLLSDGDGCGNLPLIVLWAGVLAWLPLARILRMSYQVTMNLQPPWFAL
jgi:hypothetical protein